MGEITFESLAPTVIELERAIEWAFNELGMDSIIKHKVVVSIQSKGKKAHCLAWMAPKRWSTMEGEICHEINLSAEHLDRSPEEIVASCIHEAVHLWNTELGISDVATNGRHNKKFKQAAERVGLKVTNNGDSHGFAYTQADTWLNDKITKDFMPNRKALNLFRILQIKDPKDTPEIIVWACKCETRGFKIRAKVDEDVRKHCYACSSDYEVQE